MTKFTLTLLDTTGIQDYIFSSNRLQENIGASEIVYRATTLWVFEALEKAGFAHNIILKKNKFEWDYVPDFRIENQKDDNAVEIVYAAGGNAVLVFKKTNKAIDFTKALTTKILREAPGLTLLAQHLEFEWQERLSDKVWKEKNEKGEEVEKIEKGKRSFLNDMMAEHKRKRTTLSVSLGYGVTAVCDSTGLPAIGTNEAYKSRPEESTFYISRETNAKLKNQRKANDRLELLTLDALTDESKSKSVTFPHDIDLMGRIHGEESYVAVVHIDGNRVGEHVKNSMSNIADNREYIEASRKFSKSIQIASLATLKRILKDLFVAITKDEKGNLYIRDAVPLTRKNNLDYLPFRPLIFGGDDVTFLCNGQLGVELATRYLSTFREEAKKEKLDMHASAGVSIVKMHYPFARAYKLAEELTASAKALNRAPQEDCSALDWHFAQSGLSGSLETIRKREYTPPAGRLNLRPLVMSGGARSWNTIKNTMSEFNDKWADKHNKVVGLREALRKGGNFTRAYLQDFDLMKEKLPAIHGMEDIQETGWQGGVCYYFDAIELLDHYVSLETKQKETA